MARLSLLDMEIEQDKVAAQIASPAAWGYGPALAMPTLMGMMGGSEAGAGQEGGQVSSSQITITIMYNQMYYNIDSMHANFNFWQESNLLWPSSEGGKRDSNMMPPSLVNVFQVSPRSMCFSTKLALCIA